MANNFMPLFPRFLWTVLVVLLLRRSFGTYLDRAVGVAQPLQKLRSIMATSNIQCVMCDMDGTLLTDKHTVDHTTITSIAKLVKAGIRFFPASGRTRKSVMDVTRGEFQEIFGRPMNEIPGVYSQGLQIYGKDGMLIHERFVESHLISQVAEFCEREEICVVAYARDQIFCKRQTKNTLVVTDYGDPLPEVFPRGLHLLEPSAGIKPNKLIVIADEESLVRVRPSLTALLHEKATITKAVQGMLEILPLNASKGAGVKILLDHFGIQPQDAAAIGDGENDSEMLDIVGLAVAMENAKPGLKCRADYITRSNNENGVGCVLEVIANHSRMPQN